jgi:hypothetical protein
VALDPHELVSDVTDRAHRPPGGDPPALLAHPPGPGPALDPLQGGDEVAAMHREWARLGAGAGRGGGLRGAGRATVAAAERRLPGHRAQRALIGDVIRAVDAVARRVDEIGVRLLALEELVEEVTVVTGEDLAAVRAALEPGRGGAGPPAARPPGDG